MSEPTGALAIRGDQATFTLEQKNALLKMTALSSIDEATLTAFLHVCQKRGLDPFSRQIYLIGREDKREGVTKYTVQTSIDGFRIISQRSRQYAGMTKTEWCGADGEWKDVWLDKKTSPAAARVGVLRKGFAEPLYAVAVFDSYCPRYANGDIISPLWKSMPEVMIAKCAEALARRQAFPEDLSGLYTDDEMEQASVEVEQEDSKREEKKKDKEAVSKVENIVEAEVIVSEEEIADLKKVLNEIFQVQELEALTDIFKLNFNRADVVIPLEDGETTTLKAALFIRRTEITSSLEEKENA